MIDDKEILAQDFVRRFNNLNQSYWDKILKKVNQERKEYELFEKVQSPSYEQLHNEFNI